MEYLQELRVMKDIYGGLLNNVANRLTYIFFFYDNYVLLTFVEVTTSLFTKIFVSTHVSLSRYYY